MNKHFLMTLLILSVSCTWAQKSRVVEYPYYEKTNTHTLCFTKVTADKNETVLDMMVYLGMGPYIQKNTYLLGQQTGKRYKLLSADSVEIGKPIEPTENNKDCMECRLHFEPLDDADTAFDYIEGDDVNHPWKITGISMKKRNIKDIITRDKKWGEKTVSPFAGRKYVMDSVCIQGTILNNPEKATLFYNNCFNDYTKIGINPDEKGCFSIKIPMMNTGIINMTGCGGYQTILCSPGDTIRVKFDETTPVAQLQVSDTALQKCITDYKKWNKERGYYDFSATYFIKEHKKMFDCITYILANKLTRLQNYIDEHPDFDKRAAHYLRTDIKTEALFNMLQSHFILENGHSYEKYQWELIEELFTDINEPFTLSAHYTGIFTDYSDYKTWNARYKVSMYPSTYNVLKAKNYTGEIELSKKELSIMDDMRIKYTVKLGTDNGLLDSAKMQKRLKGYEKTMKRYKELCKKHNVEDYVKKHDTYHYRILTQIILFKNNVEQLPISREEKNYVIAEKLYEILRDGSKSWSDSLLSVAMQGLENFAPAQLIKEQNEYYRRLEAKELDIKYLKNHADLTPSALKLKGDSLLATILAPYKGKVIYLDIWGTWCGPCKNEMKHVPYIKEALKGEDVVFIYMAYNSPEDVRINLVKQFGIYGDNTIHYNLPEEQQESINKLLDVKGYPTYILFDREGRIANREPSRPSSGDVLVKEIRNCLNSK